MLLDIAIIRLPHGSGHPTDTGGDIPSSGNNTCGYRRGYFRYRRSRFRLYGRYMGRASDFILINHYIRNNLRLVIAFPVF